MVGQDRAMYTVDNLTYATDKLVAASGIARFYAEILQCRYLAGLWEHGIREQLLWQAGTSSKIQSRPTEYIAPICKYCKHIWPISHISYLPCHNFLLENYRNLFA